MGKRTNTAKWVESAGRWQINVQKDGIRKTFTSSKPGRTGQREANAKADAWLENGVGTDRATLSKIFPDFLEDLKLRTSQSNWRGVEQRWRSWGEPVIGGIRPGALSDFHLQRVITQAYAQKKLSKKTLMNIRADLFSFSKYLRARKLTSYRPERVTIPHSAAVGVRTILQPEHIITLFSSEMTTWHGKPVRDPFINAYRFQLLTGLRPGELMGLMPTDIVGDRVILQRSINEYGEITSGKNENARRSFNLTPTAKTVLEAQLKEKKSIYIFGIESHSLYRRRWDAYCRANGIPHVTPYEMRHTFVSALQGLPEGWVKALVGHSRSMDSFGVYGHNFGGMDGQIASGVEAIFQDILKGG